MHLGFLKNCAVDFIEASATAGTSTLTSDVLDMAGFDGICFIAILGDVTSGSVLLLTALTNSTNSDSGGTAVAGGTAGGTAGASDYDSKLLIVDVYRPQNRYAFCTLARGTQNAVVNGILAIRYHGRKCPITQGSSVVQSTAVAPIS
jgi:hypothetical protein